MKNAIDASGRVRFGGMVTEDGFRFELSGGDLALDFANTLDERGGDEPLELLRDFGDLVNWSTQTGLVDATTAKRLLRDAKARPRIAGRAFREARMLRELIFAVFGEGDVSGSRLATLQQLHEKALKHRRLVLDGKVVRWEWTRDGLDQMLWPIVEAATALLTSERLDRVRVCEGDLCRWLFIDQSRRGNRRWCDMSVCGNRAKARRHYAKVRDSERSS